MSLTPSEVASLASRLSFWEISEYVSEGLVALACGGEYIADFTNILTKEIEERKKRLAKLSTITLIFALSLELLCLVRTNQISGRLIGSLNDRAEEAYRKSDIAVANADGAIDKAKSASDEADSAKLESGNAKDAAAEAESLARGARKEADAFKNDIAAAQKDAAEARKEAARFNEVAERERLARVKIEEKLRPRRLSPAEKATIGSALSRFSGTIIAVTIYSGDAEEAQYALDFKDVVVRAGWLANGINLRTQAPPYPTGLFLVSSSRENPPAVAFQRVLHTLGIDAPAQIGEILNAPSGPQASIELLVGLKP